MRTHVQTHDSPEHRWEFVTRPAPAQLRGYLRNYTGYDEWSAEPVSRREVPSGDVTLILSPDSALELPDTRHPGRPPARATSFVAALHDTYALVDSPRRQRGVQVRLTPLGAHALFGLPMHELANEVVRLDELLGRAGDELVGRMWEFDGTQVAADAARGTGWERRFAVLEAGLVTRLAEARPPSPELAWAWGRMRATSGTTSVAGLADELGWSHRRLIARFREQIGLPPKTLGRILRFERVSRLLLETESPRLAEVAYACGYYDQAHLNRDFREFAGTTPGAYLASRLPDGGGVVAVNSVQDAAPEAA